MDSENEKNSEVPDIEEQNEFSNDDLFNITSWGADLSFRELISMYDDEELLKPELQRKYVWDKNEASRFIESILLGLPIPSIFLANTNDNKKLIIDGYQRIMTIYDYVKKGIFSKDGKVFKLVNTERINSKWRGKSFAELDENDQRKIKQTTIHSIIFEQKQPKNDSSLYQIFERINTSGRALKPQEIRNCIYQGNLNTLLFSLNENNEWRGIFGEKEDDRMLDLELILRFFAISSEELKSKETGQISLKLFLNQFMGKKENNEAERITYLNNKFNNTLFHVIKYIGKNAFKNISEEGDYINKFHPTIYDSIMTATYHAIENGVDFELLEGMEGKHVNLLKNENFKNFTTIRTTNVVNIKGRINLACTSLYGISYE